MRVVLDANVLLAGFGTHGLCEALVAVCLESHQLVISAHILQEIRRYLTTKFKMPLKQADEILLFLKEQAEIVSPTIIPSSACRDPDDWAVLGTAVAGSVDILVTGDKDLLTLESFQDIPILTPRACYEKFSGL